MRVTTNEVGGVSPKATTAVEASGRTIVLLGGSSLYQTALQSFLESHSPHRVLLHDTDADGLDPDTLDDSAVVVLDLDLDRASNLRLQEVEHLLERIAPRPVLLISSGVDAEALQALLRRGVAGIVLKIAGCEILLEALDSISKGKVWIQRDVLVQTFAETSHQRRFCSQAEKISQLTDREREIIGVACTGLTNRQISDQLAISEATVRHHLSSIFTKLGIASRGELIVFAFRHHLGDFASGESFC